MEEEKIAQGTYDFRIMREDGFRYVDKTALLYPLITRGRDAFFFISRPRRFGKSLMLSTLEYLFQGRRDLFKGLAIDRMDYDWAEYPVLHFNFGTMDVTTFDSFYSTFVARVMQAFKEAKVTYDPAFAPGDNFANAIRSLAQDRGKPVVILIDEYDAPVGAALNDIEKAEAIRAKLSAFYGEIKNNVGNIRFMMMTGVTRFTQLSVFSALNNLTDLTMDSRYATLLGYTDEELEVNFSKTLHRHAAVMGLSYEDYREKLRWWYNGYRFARWNTAKVYNPFAIGQTLGACEPEFIGTWIATGQTSAVINYFTNNQLAERDYENVEGVTEEDLDVCGLENYSSRCHALSERVSHYQGLPHPLLHPRLPGRRGPSRFQHPARSKVCREERQRLPEPHLLGADEGRCRDLPWTPLRPLCPPRLWPSRE